MNSTMNEILIGQLGNRLIECGIHRVLACLEKLSNDQLRFRPNTNSNSINNQILHLDGNVRQWLISTVIGDGDSRRRDEEFDPSNNKSKEELITILNNLEKDIRGTFPILQSMDLTEKRDVQCYNESIVSIIVHVIEHFSYHLGQITYITKMLLDIDTGYYSDLELNRVN